jgi:thrombospondin type 3 repeat protein/dockerin type I repeat protein
MTASFRSRIFMALVVATMIGAAASLVAAETIDPQNDQHQFAWGENVGWINAEPSATGNPGVTVSGAKLTGYMYGENIGWINLNCQNNGTCGSTGNYGVTNDNLGNLSGYAWGENVGWISFSCQNVPNTCASTGNYGVTIDKATGLFGGKAWGENIGWIVFDYTTSAANRVKTDDGDGVAGASDNCAFDANANQANNDRNFVDLPPSKLFDDNTLANSDEFGDVCDSDDDNDGFLDVDEPQLGPAGTQHALCPSATGPTDPLKLDTDGDGTTDRAECLLGTDPVNAASKPAAIIAPDADNDGLPNALEATLGTNPNNRDTDGDGVSDGIEVRAYNTNPLVQDTDADGCKDGREIASVDGVSQVNSIDLQQVAVAFSANQAAPNYILDYDVDKSGQINSIDLQFVAQRIGSCP